MTFLSSFTARLFFTMILNFIITILEIVGGILSGSLALVSDAIHNLSDGLSIVITFVALKLKERGSSALHTFGFKRAEILAAVINSSVLLIITFYLFYEAGKRLFTPSHISSTMMVSVAFAGFLANVAGTWLLQRDARKSMNIRSAYLHLLSDALSSVAVILGGVAIHLWGTNWVDPLLTILIGLYILKSSYNLLMDSVHILMEGAPPAFPLEAIQNDIEALPEVRNIHHLHVWMVGENDIHLEAHVNVEDMKVSETSPLLERITHLLKEKYNVQHVTIQFECDHCLEEELIRQEGLPAKFTPQHPHSH